MGPPVCGGESTHEVTFVMCSVPHALLSTSSFCTTHVTSDFTHPGHWPPTVCLSVGFVFRNFSGAASFFPECLAYSNNREWTQFSRVAIVGPYLYSRITCAHELGVLDRLMVSSCYSLPLCQWFCCHCPCFLLQWFAIHE